MSGEAGSISDVLSPFELRSLGQAFVLELTASDHRAAVRVLMTKMQQRSAKSVKKIESSVERMSNEYKNLELLGNYVTQKKVELLTKITDGFESKRLKVAILPSTVEKIKYDSNIYQENENEAEVQKQFFRKLLDHIEGDITVPSHAKQEIKLISKKKGSFEKMKKFLRNTADKIAKEKDLIREKQNKELFSPFKSKHENELSSLSKVDPSSDVTQTPMKSCRPTEAPLSRKLSNGHLSSDPEEEKLIAKDEAEITAPARTPTKKPWYKFW